VPGLIRNGVLRTAGEPAFSGDVWMRRPDEFDYIVETGRLSRPVRHVPLPVLTQFFADYMQALARAA